MNGGPGGTLQEEKLTEQRTEKRTRDFVTMSDGTGAVKGFRIERRAGADGRPAAGGSSGDRSGGSGGRSGGSRINSANTSNRNAGSSSRRSVPATPAARGNDNGTQTAAPGMGKRTLGGARARKAVAAYNQLSVGNGWNPNGAP